MFKTLKRFKRKINQAFTKSITRKQFNFYCDRNLYFGIKTLAHYLKVPMYPLLEHLMQLGLQEGEACMQNDVLKREFINHLIQDHLLVPVINNRNEPNSTRKQSIENALSVVELLDMMANPMEQVEIIARLIQEVASIKPKTNYSDTSPQEDEFPESD